MAHTRIDGFQTIFAALVLGLDLCLFGLMVWLEPYVDFVSFTPEARPSVYALAVVFSVVYLSPSLNSYIERITLTKLFDAMGVASHLFFAKLVNFAFIYLALKDYGTSRLFLGSYLVLDWILNVAVIRLVPIGLSKLFYPEQRKDRAVLVGNGRFPKELRQYIRKCDALGIRFVGYFSDEPIGNLDLPRLGSRSEILTKSEIPVFNRVLVFNDVFCDETFREMVEHCQQQGMRLQIYTAFANAFPEQVMVVNDGNLSFFTFQDERLENPLNEHAKRWIDVIVSLPVVVFVLPVLYVVVAIAQSKQSPGPVLFKQIRYGRNREAFEIYKFRTMHANGRSSEAVQATANDPRIFPIGAFLRKTSLDEFPQFLNVLRGEMSVVGPRPHLTEHDAQFERIYRAYRTRHFVKPGITGYAQIHGFRGEVKEPSAIIERVQLDLDYISNWSIALDLYIILRTAQQVIFPPKSAY